MDIEAEKIWQKIKQAQIKPVAREIFIWKRALLWLLCVASLIISSLTTAIIIFLLRNIDWDIANRFSSSKFLFAFLAVPYFWLVLLFIFAVTVYYNYRHTKYGYRLKISVIVLIFLFLNLIFGGLAYGLDWGHKIEEVISKKISFYTHLDTQSQIWSQTEKGLLAGKVMGFEKGQVILLDLQNKVWHLSSHSNLQLINLQVGEKIKIIGSQTGSNEFLVQEIRPWCGCNKCLSGNAFCGLDTTGKNYCAGGGCEH